MSKYIVKMDEFKAKERFIKKANYVSMPKSIVYCDSKEEALFIDTEEEAHNLSNYLAGLMGIRHKVHKVEE